MRGAYVDGGGHMVANQIKSTHKYGEYKLGGTKIPWGLLHTLGVDQKNCQMFGKTETDLNICDGNPFRGLIQSQARPIKANVTPRAKLIHSSVDKIYFDISLLNFLEWHLTLSMLVVCVLKRYRSQEWRHSPRSWGWRIILSLSSMYLIAGHFQKTRVSPRWSIVQQKRSNICFWKQDSCK